MKPSQMHRKRKIPRKSKERKRIRRVWPGILGVVAIFIAVTAVALGIWKSQQTHAGSSIVYQGQAYREKENLTKILVLGIDLRGDIENTSHKAGENGQADMIGVVTIDRDTGEINVVTIPRETIIDVDEYYTDGVFYQTVQEQACLQYAYGRDSREGCELMEEKISELLGGINIDYYCAVSLMSIPDLIDEIGGLTITMSEDHVVAGKTYAAGETVTMNGEEACLFVQYRDIERNGTNLERMSRQKDFMTAFVPTVKEKMKEQRLLPLQLYRSMKGKITTDMPVWKMLGFASKAAKNDFDMEKIRQIPGEEVHVGEYDRYYPDEEELQKMIVECFYEPVS